MTKKGLFKKILVALVVSVLLLSVFSSGVLAAKRPPRPRRGDPLVVPAIPEDDQPWSGKGWLVAVLVGAGAVAVCFKDAKRSHLD